MRVQNVNTQYHNPVHCNGIKQMKMAVSALKCAHSNTRPFDSFIRCHSEGLTKNEVDAIGDMVEEAKKKALFDGHKNRLDEMFNDLRKKILGE